MTLDESKIGCAIIKIQENDYEPVRIGVLKDGHTFKVRYEDIEKTIQHIKELFVNFNMDNYIVYITGFDIVSKNDIWTEERIDAVVEAESKKKCLVKVYK